MPTNIEPAPVEAEETKDIFVFILYVAGITDQVKKMVTDLETLLENECSTACKVEVIDVITMPEQAAQNNVFVTPTLVKSFPEPIVKLIGDMKDTGRIMLALSINGEDEDEKNLLI